MTVSNTKNTALYTVLAATIITIANDLGLKVATNSTDKAATTAYIAAGLATLIHFVAEQKATKSTIKKVVHAPVSVVKKVVSPSITVMYDSIDVSQIPKSAPAVAGYVDGGYLTFSKLLVQFPKAEKVAITVFASNNIDGSPNPCLDVEKGDASPAQWINWFNAQSRKGTIPIVYANVSTMVAVLRESKSVGIPRKSFRVWTAHYGIGAHVCGPSCFSQFGGDSTMYADGTQWTDAAQGKNLDQSKLLPSFFPGTK